MVEKLNNLSEVIGFTSNRHELINKYAYTINESDINSVDDCYVIKDKNNNVKAIMFFNPVIKDITLLISNVKGYGKILIKYIQDRYNKITLFCKSNLILYYENLGFVLINNGTYCEMKYIKG